MEVEIISDSSTFQKMRDEWNGLASNFHSPLLRHEWFASCIIAVRLGGRLRAAAPLVTMHLGLVPHMEILGAEVFGEPCGFLYDSQAALMTLFQAILERRRSLSLPRFKIEAQEARVLNTMLSTNWFSINRSGASSLRVPLKSTWKEFDASISPGRRSDLRG